MTRLRDIMPKGFYARTVLIMFVPIVALMVVMTWYYFDDHLKGINERLSDALGRDFAVVSLTHDRSPDMTPAAIDIISDTQNYMLTVSAACPVSDDRARVERAYPSFVKAINTHLERPYALAFGGERDDFVVCVPSNEDVLVFNVPRKRAVVLNGHIFIVWVVGIGLILLLTGFLFLRNQVRSILRLEELARAYGRGRDVRGFKPSGATEIREAARAIIDMRSRLTAAAEQRTAMLAAVSHDLRTPLTRLKLQLAMVEQDDDIRAAQRDLDDMAAMLDEYLAFAQGEGGETAEPASVSVIVRTVAETVDQGQGRVRLGELPDVTKPVRKLALKRAFSNILSNALDHASSVRVSVKPGPRATDILFDDDGPGIPPERHEEAFRPFSRLDPARNQNKAGVGLGLALARDVARSHGGDIRLEQSPEGGLRVRFRLPN